MPKTISTSLTKSNLEAVLTLLADTPRQLERWGQAKTPAQLRQPLGSGERSTTQVLAHLVNCEARGAEAIYSALLVEAPEFLNIHPERQLGKLLRFEEFAFAELLAYFKLRRAVLLRVLTPLSEAQWVRIIREAGKQRQESVYWRARTLALHEREHLAEVDAKLLKE